MYSVCRPFDMAPIPFHLEGVINHTKIKVSCQKMAKENLISWEEIVNWNHNPHVTPTSSVSLKPKKPNLSNLTEYQKVQPFVIKLFKETREMLEKSAIKEESYYKEQFVTHLCLVPKNDGEERPGINEVSSKLIMYLNIFHIHTLQTFQMERLHLLEKTLRKSDYLCKFNLKEVYVCVPLKKQSTIYLHFE